LLVNIAADKPPLEPVAGDRRGEDTAARINDKIAKVGEILDKPLEDRHGLLPVVVCLFLTFDINRIAEAMW
jgi:hypothetical protein